MRAMATRAATCALDVEVRWGDGELLSTEHLRALASYILSSDKLPDGHSGFVVSDGCLDAPHTLAELHADHVVVHAVAGTSATLRLGEQTVVHVGPLVFRLAVVEPRAEAARPWRLDPREQAWTVASFMLHAFALGCMMWMPPRASSLSLDLMSEDTAYARYLTTPVERVEEKLPWSADDNKPEPTNEGARAKGESGKAGKQDAARTDKRMAVKGESKTRELARQPTTEQVQNVGLLGALAKASMNLGPTALHGADTEVGYDPKTAIGAVFGAQIGDDFGFGGLGQKGTGRSGGGDAEGTYGLGDLGTGNAARTALGATGSFGPRKKEHVPLLRVHDAEVRGSLSKEVIRRTIHRRLNEVRFCYEQALASEPGLVGRVSVSFMIAPSGAVQAAAIKDNTMTSRRVAECVTQAVRRMVFPTPDGGGYVQVTYPFSFSAD